MSDVGVVFKVYPKDGELEHLMDDLKKMGPKGMSTDDIGFGIKVVKVLFVFNNDNANSSEFENKIKALPSVSEVEVQEESLI